MKVEKWKPFSLFLNAVSVNKWTARVEIFLSLPMTESMLWGKTLTFLPVVKGHPEPLNSLTFPASTSLLTPCDCADKGLLM